jgi:medium-chain acyl-[acyl-carrier-protein] hydrolase
MVTAWARSSVSALRASCTAGALRRRCTCSCQDGGRRTWWIRSPISQRPEPALLARLRKLGGIPAAVLREGDLMALFLPILRADMAVNDSETPAAPPLACPITVMGGLADEMATLDELDAWRVHTTAAFERETFSGRHFFIQTARAEFLGSLARRLAQIVAAS